MKKPCWLNKKVSLKECQRLKGLLRGLGLHTICEEAACPNISECFSKNTATFMILGDTCSRDCKFCNVKKGAPAAVDPKEPLKVAEAAKRLGLRHIVITSVTRDDLDDGGASAFAETVGTIREETDATIEALIPDFKGSEEAVKKVVDAAPEVIDHNVETVPRLYPQVRPMADYGRSLEVLRTAKRFGNGGRLYTKSGLMVGLGETEEEVFGVFSDLRDVNCDFLSIGQYLAPGLSHYPVQEYITPERFDYYKEKALEMGFLSVASAPYVRSSYLAAEYLNKNGEVK